MVEIVYFKCLGVLIPMNQYVAPTMSISTIFHMFWVRFGYQDSIEGSLKRCILMATYLYIVIMLFDSNLHEHRS
jgi:hypothetical protein